MRKTVEQARKSRKASVVKDVPNQQIIPHGSYSERFILYPNLFYESTVEDCDIKITNLSGKFKRITFVIENYKEKSI